MSNAASQIKNLESYHGKTLPQQAIIDYTFSLESYSDDELARAVMQWKKQNAPTGRFPSIADIVHSVVLVREEMWQAEKKRGTGALATFEARLKKSSGDIAKETFLLIEKMEEDRKNRVPTQEYRSNVINGMMRLHETYPRAGWAMEADKLRTHWK